MRMIGNFVWFVSGGAITGIVWGVAGVFVGCYSDWYSNQQAMF